MIHRLIKGLAPVAALALSAVVAGCGDMNVEINGEKGVPLAELDMSGDPPEVLVLAGPDKVILSEGQALDIDIEGDAADLVRFTLKDGALGVLREPGNWKDSGTAIVRVTMPVPRSITIAGSGDVEAQGMASEAEIVIAGSGRLKVAALAATRADVTIAGSGSLEAAGSADRLDLTIAGSGGADMARLKVENAEVTIAGAGTAGFASDGKVEANIMGSGDVQVTGRATCEIKAMGSGTLTCTPAEAEGRSEAAPAA